MKKMMTSLCLALCAFGTLVGFGQAGVTASRDYVNRKTELHEVMHPGDTNVVGYFLGTQTNKVLASKEYVDDSISASSPGDYNTVSNAAVKSRAKTDMVVYDTNGVSTVDRLATTGDVEVAVNRVRTDRITDGTNIIDAARMVFQLQDGYGEWSWTIDPEADASFDIHWGSSDGVYDGWYFDGSVGEHGGPDYFIGGNITSTNLTYTSYFESATEYVVTFSRPVIHGSLTNIVGRLALTNDIPHAVSVVAPSTNAASGTAADAKATGTALYTGFTEWEFSGSAYSPSNQYEVRISPNHDFEEYDYIYEVFENGDQFAYDFGTDPNPVKLIFGYINCTRHLVTPTKTSQLINDGDGTNVFATVNLIDASNETFSNAVLSVGIGIDTNTVAAINALVESGDDLPIGGATSVGAILLAIVAAIAALKRRMTAVETSIGGKANATDLPYEIVTPGEWEFSDGGANSISGPIDDGTGKFVFILDGAIESLEHFSTESDANSALSLTFNNWGTLVAATRASLPGHLLDRAVNKVELGSDVSSYTLTFPAVPENGRARDFFVRLIIQGNTPPTISFVEADGTTPVAFDADDDSWADIEPGVNILMFTDTAR